MIVNDCMKYYYSKLAERQWCQFCKLFAGRIVNLEPGATVPVVILQGRSVLPFCHIDLEESDYLTSGRRNPNLGVPQAGIDPSTHVLEFRATGVGTFVERHFPVINPTDVSYSFKWINRDETVDQSKKPPFRCCVPSGSIIKGQQCTVGRIVQSSSSVTVTHVICCSQFTWAVATILSEQQLPQIFSPLDQ